MKQLTTALLALTCATSLAACSPSPESPSLAGKTWQVVALHTEPGVSGELPPDVAGKVSLTFGRSSSSAPTEMVMNTGCAPLRATTQSSPETLRLDNVELGDVDGCVGGSRYAHDLVTDLLVSGAELDINMLSDTEAVLTVNTDALEKPSFRIMAL